MGPRNPNPVASYWGVDPTLVPPENSSAVAQYWGTEPVNSAVPQATDNPFAAGAASVGISPQTYAPAAPPAAPGDPFAAGAANAGIAPPQEHVYNDFIPAGAGPSSVAGAPSVSLVDPPKLAGGLTPPQPSANAPAAAPIGPTAADDAAFEQFKAQIAAKPAPAPARSGPANPDPYGIGAAQRAQLAAMDARVGAMGRAANAEQYRALQTAEHQQMLARMQEEDAAIARSEQDYANRHFDEQMTEIGRQLDDVRARKVDPLKDFKESPALGVLAVIGGAISGFYQGITNGQQNQFIADLERHIDRGVAEQERQIREEKFALGEGVNMLGQQRQAQKDDALAKMQLRNLAYEAAKNEINAEADRDGTEIGREHANEAIAQVQMAQAQLQEQIARQKQAQALAAANQAHAHAKEVQQAIFSQYEKNLASGMAPGQAVDWARHLIGLVYAPGTPGNARPAWDESHAGLTKEQRGKMAMEHAEAQRASDEFNAQIDSMKRHPALGKLGLSTGATSHLGQRVAPESAAVVQDLKTINTMTLQAVGKVAKDADGKPNKAMIEKLEERFEIHPTDTREMAIQKLEGARDAVNALARQQGATGAPRPGAQRDIAASLGAKPVGR